MCFATYRPKLKSVTFKKVCLWPVSHLFPNNPRITNFPLLSTNIPSLPAYDIFILQLIRYVRDCAFYECFIQRAGDFHISFSGRDMSRTSEIVSLGVLWWIRRSFPRMGSPPVQNVTRHSEAWPYAVTPSTNKIYTNLWHFLNWTLFSKITKGFHIPFVPGAASQQRTLTPRTPGPVPFGTCMF